MLKLYNCLRVLTHYKNMDQDTVFIFMHAESSTCKYQRKHQPLMGTSVHHPHQQNCVLGAASVTQKKKKKTFGKTFNLGVC